MIENKLKNSKEEFGNFLKSYLEKKLKPSLIQFKGLKQYIASTINESTAEIAKDHEIKKKLRAQIKILTLKNANKESEKEVQHLLQKILSGYLEKKCWVQGVENFENIMEN